MPSWGLSESIGRSATGPHNAKGGVEPSVTIMATRARAAAVMLEQWGEHCHRDGSSCARQAGEPTRLTTVFEREAGRKGRCRSPAPKWTRFAGDPRDFPQ
jgi:hypothetical protein